MRSSSVFALLLLLSGSNIFGCGDKFLVVGRGVALQHGYTARHPASILMYTNGSSMERREMRARLKMAGHSIRRVDDEVMLSEAVKSGRYNIVLGGIKDAAKIEPMVHDVPAVIFLPVILNPSKSELAAIKSAYGCALRADEKPQDFLVVIDEVMAQELQKIQKPVCNISQ